MIYLSRHHHKVVSKAVDIILLLIILYLTSTICELAEVLKFNVNKFQQRLKIMYSNIRGSGFTSCIYKRRQDLRKNYILDFDEAVCYALNSRVDISYDMIIQLAIYSS